MQYDPLFACESSDSVGFLKDGTSWENLDVTQSVDGVEADRYLTLLWSLIDLLCICNKYKLGSTTYVTNARRKTFVCFIEDWFPFVSFVTSHVSMKCEVFRSEFMLTFSCSDVH